MDPNFFSYLILYGLLTGVLPALVVIALILIVKGITKFIDSLSKTDYTPISKTERKEKRLKTFSEIGNRED